VPCPVRHMEAPDEVSRKSSPPCGGLLDSQRARLRACSRSCRKARGRGAVQGRRRRRAERACPGRRRGASYLSVARPRSSTLRTRRAPEWQRRFWIEPPAQCGHTRYDARGNQILRTGPSVAGGRQRIEYTPFNLPKVIETGPQEAASLSTFGYDADNARVLKRNATTNSVFIGGLYDRVEDLGPGTEW